MRDKERNLVLLSLVVHMMVSGYKKSRGVRVRSPHLVFSLHTQSFWVVIGLSLVVGLGHKVSNFSLVVLSELHPASLQILWLES